MFSFTLTNESIQLAEFLNLTNETFMLLPNTMLEGIISQNLFQLIPKQNHGFCLFQSFLLTLVYMH